MNKPVHSIAVRLLEVQLMHDRAMKLVIDAGIHLGQEHDIDILNIIADWYGVPKDNTLETDACSRALVTGEWPDDAYCRDWVYDEWQLAVDGERDIEQFISLLSEARRIEDRLKRIRSEMNCLHSAFQVATGQDSSEGEE